MLFHDVWSEQDTLQDYQEMFIQFGYVVLFSSAFPLAAMCALINNIIEIRSDALKLCTGLQRPFGQRVENIGQWQVRAFCLENVRQAFNSTECKVGLLKMSPSLSFSVLQTAMEAMGLIAIIVNCYLIGQCGQIQRLFPWLSPEMTIISIVLLEVCNVSSTLNACECGFIPKYYKSTDMHGLLFFVVVVILIKKNLLETGSLMNAKTFPGFLVYV